LQPVGSPSSGRTCVRWHCDPDRARARNSFSSADWTLAGYSASFRRPQPDGGSHRCRSPYRRAGCGRWTSASGVRLPPYNPRPGPRSGERRWDGRNGLSGHGSSSCAHPASARSPACIPPFSAGGRAVRPNRRTVDQHFLRWPAGTGQRMEKLAPYPFAGPADVAIIERLARSVIRRCIDPATARLENMDDPADHPLVIDTRLPPRVARQMRRNTRKLFVRKPKAIPTHSQPPSAANLESDNHLAVNLFYGSGP
jgi:hypothetical protein